MILFSSLIHQKNRRRRNFLEHLYHAIYKSIMDFCSHLKHFLWNYFDLNYFTEKYFQKFGVQYLGCIQNHFWIWKVAAKKRVVRSADINNINLNKWNDFMDILQILFDSCFFCCKDTNPLQFTRNSTSFWLQVHKYQYFSLNFYVAGNPATSWNRLSHDNHHNLQFCRQITCSGIVLQSSQEHYRLENHHWLQSNYFFQFKLQGLWKSLFLSK